MKRALPDTYVAVTLTTGVRMYMDSGQGEQFREEWHALENQCAPLRFTDLSGSEVSVAGETIAYVHDSTPATREFDERVAQEIKPQAFDN